MYTDPISIATEIVRPDTAQVGVTNRFESYLESVNEHLNQADKTVEAYVAGEDVTVQQAMLELSSAKAKLQMVVETRNRLLEGFNEVMRMQI